MSALQMTSPEGQVEVEKLFAWILTAHLGVLLLLPLLQFTLHLLQLLLVRVRQEVHDGLWERQGRLVPPGGLSTALEESPNPTPLPG